jgi:hypothetical protein
MPKLIDREPSKFNQIGPDGLLRFIDEMNDKRARLGIPQRYIAVKGDDGKLTMREMMPPRPTQLPPADREGSTRRFVDALPSAFD